MDMLHPTGEWVGAADDFCDGAEPASVTPGPEAHGSTGWCPAPSHWRCSFAYAMLHLIFYLIDMGNLDDILAEWLAPGIWTGWAAFALMLPLGGDQQ
jgi:sulfoxide reductase heme-binding subunit YedZ